MPGRRKFIVPAHVWSVARDAAGDFVILDELGAQPLRAADPVQLLHNLYLAAAAPILRAAVAPVVRRLEYLDTCLKRDDGLILAGWCALYACSPPCSEVESVQREGGQVNIVFRHAA